MIGERRRIGSAVAVVGVAEFQSGTYACDALGAQTLQKPGWQACPRFLQRGGKWLKKKGMRFALLRWSTKSAPFEAPFATQGKQGKDAEN